jgi:hypothetical protein
MKHQLLVEDLQPNQARIVTESSADGKTLWLNGIMMQGVDENRNHRKYPLIEIENAVRIAQQKIAECNGIFGELDHPQTLQINMDRVSHAITEMWMVGNNAYGKAKIIEKAPMGQIAKALIESGVRVGVSSRGAGNVNESGEVSGFNFITVDIVCTPSAQLAMPGSVYESLELAKNGKQILTLAQSVCEDPDAQKYFKKEILAWLSTGIYKKR